MKRAASMPALNFNLNQDSYHQINQAASIYEVGRSLDRQPNIQNKVLQHEPPAMAHAASMPALEFNTNERLLDQQKNQVQRPCQINRTSVHQPNPTNQTTQHRSSSVDYIQTVDISNESILSMIVSIWDLHPSLVRLQIPTNERISSNDLIDLLSVIIPS